MESIEESKTTNKAELLVLPYNLLPISPGKIINIIPLGNFTKSNQLFEEFHFVRV